MPQRNSAVFSVISPTLHCYLGKKAAKPGSASFGLSEAQSQASGLHWKTCSLAPHTLKPLLLTRGGEEIRVVVVSLMQRVMGVRSQEGGCGHERVAIVQQRHPGGQRAGEMVGGHLP